MRVVRRSARARYKTRDHDWTQNRWYSGSDRAAGHISIPATAGCDPFLGHVATWAWLRTEWWGILGLIGWAYLTAAIIWLVLGRRREWLMGAMAILILVHLAINRGGLFARVDGKPWLGLLIPLFHWLAGGIGQIDQFVSLRDATGSLAAISVAGCVLGSILRRDSDVTSPRDRLSWAFAFTIMLLIMGFVTDAFEGINKIAATPTWCLWSAALACAAWMLLYWIIDVAGFRRWAIVVRPAGPTRSWPIFCTPSPSSWLACSVCTASYLGTTAPTIRTLSWGGRSSWLW